ncbi:hypothetical protein OHT93_18670 [Streptomyces sp. NBC_00191]|uniref:hypothetical protein n=1 Tax=Streptomyces sp. NBC_00191 TaxID=2975674 RepID=UPI003255BD14
MPSPVATASACLGLFDGADVAAPPVVIYAFSLGGPLSVSVLSLWEVRRLRIRCGVTLRRRWVVGSDEAQELSTKRTDQA